MSCAASTAPSWNGPLSISQRRAGAEHRDVTPKKLLMRYGAAAIHN